MRRSFYILPAMLILLFTLPACANAEVTQAADPEGTLLCEKDGIAAKAVPTKDGDYCVFITNNTDGVIDELDATIYYMDGNGQIVDFQADGHDMVLAGSTVVSKIVMIKEFACAKLDIEYELGVNPRYENHAKNVSITSNIGNDNLIIQITNGGEVQIAEIEYAVVYYLGAEIVKVGYPHDVYKVEAGGTAIEKEYTPKEFDRYEIYLNQAHTFGF